MTQLDIFTPSEAIERLPAQSFGQKGKRAWFWQDGSWQVGRAWRVDDEGRVLGMCRDYGPWGVPYGGAAAMETHGRWKAHEVKWKRPTNQCERPAQ
jgi:hypothetical protein